MDIINEPLSYKGNFVFVGKFSRHIDWLRRKTICLKYPYYVVVAKHLIIIHSLPPVRLRVKRLGQLSGC